MQLVPLQFPITFLIVLSSSRMHVAIHLDHKPDGVTIEIHDESRDDLLSAEMEVIDLIATQGSPQESFSPRHFFAQLLGPEQLLLADPLPQYHRITLAHPPNMERSGGSAMIILVRDLPVSTRTTDPG